MTTQLKFLITDKPLIEYYILVQVINQLKIVLVLVIRIMICSGIINLMNLFV